MVPFKHSKTRCQPTLLSVTKQSYGAHSLQDPRAEWCPDGTYQDKVAKDIGRKDLLEAVGSDPVVLGQQSLRGGEHLDHLSETAEESRTTFKRSGNRSPCCPNCPKPMSLIL